MSRVVGRTSFQPCLSWGNTVDPASLPEIVPASPLPQQIAFDTDEVDSSAPVLNLRECDASAMHGAQTWTLQVAEVMKDYYTALRVLHCYIDIIDRI